LKIEFKVLNCKSGSARFDRLFNFQFSNSSSCWRVICCLFRIAKTSLTKQNRTISSSVF
jgi:hypothetical protein